MILAFAFFSLVFSSAVWLIYASLFVMETAQRLQGGVTLFDMAVYAAFILLPVVAVWFVFGLVNQYIHNRTFNASLAALFKQMKKNQDYTDLVARVLLEAEQQIKDGFALNRFDLLIQDMNEILAEVIYRSNIASPEQIERLWARVQNGGKGAFAKVLIEVNQNQPNFKLRVFDKARKDNVLAGSILEFAARYQGLLAILEKHDKERNFINIIETGVFGKVFSILAPLADEIKRSREISSSFGGKTDFYVDDLVEEEPAPTAEVQTYPFEPAGVKSVSQNLKSSLASKVSKINVFKKKTAPAPKTEPVVGIGGTEERDPLSIALERSFGTPKEEDNEPHFDAMPAPADGALEDESVLAAEPAENKPQENEEILTDTQKKLNDLKKEWEDMKKPITASAAKAVGDDSLPEEKTEETETLAYPFGGWTDEENYNR